VITYIDLKNLYIFLNKLLFSAPFKKTGTPKKYCLRNNYPNGLNCTKLCNEPVQTFLLSMYVTALLSLSG